MCRMAPSFDLNNKCIVVLPNITFKTVSTRDYTWYDNTTMIAFHDSAILWYHLQFGTIYFWRDVICTSMEYLQVRIKISFFWLYIIFHVYLLPENSYSMHWGINPPQKHPLFLTRTPLKSANCPSHPFYVIPPNILVFRETLKIRFSVNSNIKIFHLYPDPIF